MKTPECITTMPYLDFAIYMGLGVEKDYNASIELLNGLTHEFLPVFYLGFAYHNGPDDIHDYNRAFRLFQKVLIFKHNDRSKSVLGRLKSPSEHNTSNGEYSFTPEPESVFQGEAYYYLGIMHKNGQGTAQDEREAEKCFLKAVEYGNKEAKKIH